MYLYKLAGTLGITGETADAFAPSGIFTAGNTLFFDNVPVVGGVVTGTMGPGTTVFNGFTVVFETIPEPSTLMLLGLGGLVLGMLRRRKA